MACSRFEYTKHFESETKALRSTFMVIRVDGKGFSEFTTKHRYAKPNDDRGIQLMVEAARRTMAGIPEMIAGYGQSDEFSFVFGRECGLLGRRVQKLVSLVASLFTANFVMLWPSFFDIELLSPPYFDGRLVEYPTAKSLHDYLAWRQADCHVNNQYNECFWRLVGTGMSTNEAYERLKTTQTKDKNDLLFDDFNVNYNDLPQAHRKGAIIVRIPPAKVQLTREEHMNQRNRCTTPIKEGPLKVLHEDWIGSDFWLQYPSVLPEVTALFS